MERKIKSLKSSRTASLYMDMVSILCEFIKAECTGNWELHIEAISDMLPYLAASGHNLYTRSARKYLQMMSTLKDEHPRIYEQFIDGFACGEKKWAGLSTDLVIEQVLMRIIKTSGSLNLGKF